MTVSHALVRLASRLFTFDELKAGYHKLFDPELKLSGIGSNIAYSAMYAAKRIGLLPNLHRAYLSNRPLANRDAPPNRLYDAGHLHLTMNRIYDLPQVVVDNTRPRSVNVLVPAFDFRSMSAGFFGVFQVAQFVARLGYHVRLVMFDNFYFNLKEFSEKFKGYPELEDLFEICEVEYIGERKRPLAVSSDDVCIATVWYSAYFAQKIHGVLKRRAFIYLIQDYETAFYPGNTNFTQADRSYDMDYVGLFSSRSLMDYFLKNNIGSIADRDLPHTFFNNACAGLLPARETFLGRRARGRKRRLAFYSRPVVDRNMFELSALVLCEAYSRGIINQADWEVFGIGLGEGDVRLAPGVTTTKLPRMNLADYREAISDFDVCLTLMASPHPSMIPMDFACSGSIVVTNAFKTKTAEYLSQLCKNIISAQPSLEDLVTALGEATRRSLDVEARYDAALRSQYPRSWQEVFTDEHAKFIHAAIAGSLTSEMPRTEERSHHPVSQRLFAAESALPDKQRTVLVVGSGRGGTSLVAGMLSAMGVPMTATTSMKVNYEDWELVHAAQGIDAQQRKLKASPERTKETLIAAIRHRNSLSDVWGWKDPSADVYLEWIAPELRNPLVIFVCRDIAAVAGAHITLNHMPPELAVQEAQARYDRYWSILNRLRLPTLIVSYERAKLDPKQLLRDLGDFLDVEIMPDTEHLVDGFVSPAGGYRNLAPIGAEPYNHKLGKLRSMMVPPRSAPPTSH